MAIERTSKLGVLETVFLGGILASTGGGAFVSNSISEKLSDLRHDMNRMSETTEQAIGETKMHLNMHDAELLRHDDEIKEHDQELRRLNRAMGAKR